MIEIVNRYTRTILYTSETADSIVAAVVEAVSQGADLGDANLGDANLRGAYLGDADLGGADLRGADLGGADLRGANLRGADLGGANLGDAYLGGADLGGATGISKYLTTPMYLLTDQPGVIRAYKLVDAELRSPIQDNGKITYAIGSEVVIDDADTDESEQCARGVNLASLDWCLREWKEGRRILIAEFVAADIAAIPIGSDGKFRVRRCRIVGERPMSEWGDGPWNAKVDEEEKEKP